MGRGALKSAEMAGRVFPRKAYDGTRAWLDEATEKTPPYRTGYTHPGSGKVFVPGLNENFEHHETMSAICVLARLLMDKSRKDPRASALADLLVKDRPRWEGRWTDFYYWYYAGQALFFLDGPSGPKWKSWNTSMKEALLKNQNPESAGCRAGSGEPVDRWSGEGGRVYATALNALALEVHYRYDLKAPFSK